MSEINMTPSGGCDVGVANYFYHHSAGTDPLSGNVDLPRASNVPNEVKPTTVQLAVNAQGEVFWNQPKVSARGTGGQRLKTSSRCTTAAGNSSTR